MKISRQIILVAPLPEGAKVIYKRLKLKDEEGRKSIKKQLKRRKK